MYNHAWQNKKKRRENSNLFVHLYVKIISLENYHLDFIVSDACYEFIIFTLFVLFVNKIQNKTNN